MELTPVLLKIEFKSVFFRLKHFFMEEGMINDRSIIKEDKTINWFNSKYTLYFPNL